MSSEFQQPSDVKHRNTYTVSGEQGWENQRQRPAELSQLSLTPHAGEKKALFKAYINGCNFRYHQFHLKMHPWVQ